MINLNDSPSRLYTATTIVRDKLLSDEAIRSLVGENVFPCVANDRTEGNFIVLKRMQYDRSRSKMSIVSNSLMMEVAIVTEDYDKGIEIAYCVDKSLESGLYPFSTEIDLVELIGAYEEYSDHKYIQVLEYELS